NFAAAKTTVCIGDTLQFIDSSKAATSLTYRWDFGDGTSSTLASPQHIYAQKSISTVRLIVRDSALCADTLTRSNYIKVPSPTAGFTMDKTSAICPPLAVNF